MDYSDEMLMAYVDGEVDEDTRAAVAAAAVREPALAARIARHVALRTALRTSYDGALDEAVPERLIAAARRGSGAAEATSVTVLAEARATRQRRSPESWARREWLAVAASVTLGVAVGLMLGRGGAGSRSSQLLAFDRGLPTASGQLAQVLATRLASDAGPGDPIRLGVSFRAKTGEYCRVFALPAQEGLSGLACHGQGDWRVLSLQGRPASAPAGGDFRTAAAGTAPAVIAAVDELIDGEALDAAGENAALARGWR